MNNPDKKGPITKLLEDRIEEMNSEVRKRERKDKGDFYVITGDYLITELKKLLPRIQELESDTLSEVLENKYQATWEILADFTTTDIYHNCTRGYEIRAFEDYIQKKLLESQSSNP